MTSFKVAAELLFDITVTTLLHTFTKQETHVKIINLHNKAKIIYNCKRHIYWTVRTKKKTK